jgi:hypothetical protein
VPEFFGDIADSLKPFATKTFKFFIVPGISKNRRIYFPTCWDFPEILGMDFWKKNVRLVKKNKNCFAVNWLTASGYA